MHVEPNVVSQAVDEILAERSTLAVFSMRVDVIVGDIHQPVFFASAGKMRAGLNGRKRRVLSAKNDFVDFALARSEFAISGNRARDVRGIAGVLRAYVEDNDVTVFNLARKLVVVQRRRIWSCADYRRIAFSFG